MSEKEVILLGGGTSVKEGISLGLWEKISGREIWSCNYGWKYMPYLPTRELWVDRAFFDRNVDDINALWKAGVKLYAKKDTVYCHINHFLGEAITQYDQIREPNGFKGVHALRELTPFIYAGRGGLVGMYALSLAFAERYTKIVLLGYDQGTPVYGDKNTHWYQEGFKGFSTGVGNPDIYMDAMKSLKWKTDFDVYVPNMQEFGIKVINVSPTSNIRTFPKLSYPEFFDMLKAESGQ